MSFRIFHVILVNSHAFFVTSRQILESRINIRAAEKKRVMKKPPPSCVKHQLMVTSTPVKWWECAWGGGVA